MKVSREIGATLEEIVTSVNQVMKLATEVSSASREQTAGINQINTAVADMSQVTQSNAANAEEAAAAGVELSAQATDLNTAVRQLLAVIGGQGSAPNQGTARGLLESGRGHIVYPAPRALSGRGEPALLTAEVPE